jgi:hypothetical protein
MLEPGGLLFDLILLSPVHNEHAFDLESYYTFLTTALLLLIDQITPFSHLSFAHDGRSRCITVGALNMMDAFVCISGPQT